MHHQFRGSLLTRRSILGSLAG